MTEDILGLLRSEDNENVREGCFAAGEAKLEEAVPLLAVSALAQALVVGTVGYGIGQVIGPWAAGWVATRVEGFALPLAGAAIAVLGSAVLSAIGHVASGRRPSVPAH